MSVRRIARLGLVLTALVSWAAPAFAQSGPAEDAVPPPVSLDTLLRLPASTVTAPASTKGGFTRKEWQQRFTEARTDLAVARARLAKAQGELEALAAGSETWQVAAPGGAPGGDTGPLSYGKREEIRRGREDVAAAESDLDELRIQASLAGVPEEWRQAPETAVSPSAP